MATKKARDLIPNEDTVIGEGGIPRVVRRVQRNGNTVDVTWYGISGAYTYPADADMTIAEGN